MAERVERVERELAGVAPFFAEPLPLLLAELALTDAVTDAPPGVDAATESISMASSPLTEVVADEVEPMRKPLRKSRALSGSTVYVAIGVCVCARARGEGYHERR